VLGKDHPEYRAWCGRAFRAVLDEDEAALELVKPLTQSFRRQVDALPR
jgi:hypothetical protein